MEYLLFPKKTYFLTQGYGQGSYSHIYRKALDVSSVSGSKKIYAPFTGTIQKKFVSTPNIAYTCWFVSNEKVMCADGEKRYAVIMMTHPNEIKNIKVGTIYNQGDYMFDDGTSGGVSAHLDFEISVYDNKDDIVVDWYETPDGSYALYNAVDPTDYMVLANNTKIIDAYYYPLKKSYDFDRVEDIINKNYYYSGGTYELIYEKYLRTTPKLGNNIVNAKDVDNNTKKLLVSDTGKAKFKKGTIITSLKVYEELNGRIWGSYGNCWYCMQNIDGTKNSLKV